MPAFDAPLLPSQCEERLGLRCYGAPQLQAAYGVDALHERGITGEGQTIAIVVPWGHPTAQHDLDVYSDTYGLPRTQIEQIKLGDVQDADPSNLAQASWTHEVNLDLQAAHLMAPGANLILVSTPVDGLDRGTRGWQEVSSAIDWVTAHRDVTAISMSYGTYERNFVEQAEEAGRPDEYDLLEPLRAGMVAAASRGTTLLAATGNTGPTGPSLDGPLYEHRATPWPATDPLVTGVGATEIHVSDDGERTAPEEVWQTRRLGGASGAGMSQRWEGWRSVDMSLNGAHRSRTWVYTSATDGEPGWLPTAGTSVASPLAAGLVALAAQRAGHNLGPISDELALIRPGTHGTLDVTTGCNTIDDPEHVNAADVPGWCAHPGRDVATGVGTVNDADAFTRALAAMNGGVAVP
jgi:subtilase family serine protease